MPKRKQRQQQLRNQSTRMSQNRDGSSDLNYLNETFRPIFYTFEIGKSHDWFLFESSGATVCSLLKKMTYPTEWTCLKLTGPLGLKPRITLATIARGFGQICLLGSLIRFYSGARERENSLLSGDNAIFDSGISANRAWFVIRQRLQR